MYCKILTNRTGAEQFFQSDFFYDFGGAVFECTRAWRLELNRIKKIHEGFSHYYEEWRDVRLVSLYKDGYVNIAVKVTSTK